MYLDFKNTALVLKFKFSVIFYRYTSFWEQNKLKKTILKTLIVVGIGIGVLMVPFFIDNEPQLIAEQITAK